MRKREIRRGDSEGREERDPGGNDLNRHTDLVHARFARCSRLTGLWMFCFLLIIRHAHSTGASAIRLFPTYGVLLLSSSLDTSIKVQS